MSTETRTNPFKGKAKAAGDGDFKTEIPSADTHDARVVAMIDLGTHEESYQGAEPADKRKCLIVFELDEEMTGMKGVNHVIAKEYTLSFHEKASLRQLAELLTNDGKPFAADSDVDLDAMLGLPCAVTIAHEQGKGEKADRTYARLKQVSAVARKKHPQHFKAKREVVSWFVGDDPAELPDYLPRVYGEKVEDKIARCKELGGSSSAADGEGEVGGEGRRNAPPF